MEYRDELDRAAKLHGWEDRDDSPDCSLCVHQPMCSGKNCHFDWKWKPEDLEKKYYCVNDWEERLSDELYSMRDRAEKFADWPRDLDGPFFTEKDEWSRHHPKKYYTIRLSLSVNVRAQDVIDAKRLACEKFGVKNIDNEEIGGDVDMERMADVDVLYQYRMPVRYNCCEEGHSYGYKYVRAKNRQEAKFLLQESWVPDIEADPDFDGIEEYDEEEKEWY